MTIILSSTYDDDYIFSLPIVVWAWRKLGFEVIVFLPEEISPLDDFLSDNLDADVYAFDAPKDKIATYSQVIRLYASGLPLLKEDEQLIISDADMLFLQKGYFIKDPRMTIYGPDLTPLGQYPMCYASASVKEWRRLLSIDGTPQEMCDKTLAHINVENMRGNYWSYDQELLFNATHKEAFKINRARPGTQYATNRIDRGDGNWADNLSDAIDCHLWRPGYTEENFARIMMVLKYRWPKENFSWVEEYREKFLQLI